MSYRVREVFYSLQGEGRRAGTPVTFVRFAGCNLRCTRATAGFDCDTDHSSQVDVMGLSDLMQVIDRATTTCRALVLTGGEPLLQLDPPLARELLARALPVAIETNGTIEPAAEVLGCISWVACSPKRGTITKLRRADELKFVLAAGEQPWPVGTQADAWLVSPAAEGLYLPPENVEWCVRWCLENPRFSLSVQLHKILGLR